MSVSGITGIFLVDGGKLWDEIGLPSLNRFTWYRTQLLPSFGLVLQGLENRLNASGFNYRVNMTRTGATGYVISGRSATFISRGTLNGISGDTTPVVVLNWASGDFAVTDDYRMQYRAENASDATRVEYFPIIDITILDEV
jgi:hypothetical protein